jgi:radical SAM superfamily enzyme YgiQ (UPF0313 family)
MSPLFLLINPWLHDFSAYDFWLKPMGLLPLASALKRAGAEVQFLDCLDHRHPLASDLASRLKRRKDGQGQLLSQEIPKPEPLRRLIPRRFKRYGLPPALVRQILAALPKPDAVLIGSLMTYWYPGVAETIAIVKAVFPEAPVILGGLYPTLLPDHARLHSGADRIVAGNWEDSLPQVLAEATGARLDLPGPLEVSPAWELYPRLDHAVLLTGRGCRFRCRYCVAHRLHPKIERRQPEAVIDEIAKLFHERGVRDFAFYDDALLEDMEHHLAPLLQGLIRLNLPVRFHAINGLSLAGLTAELARLLRQSGFATLRFGLETTDPARLHQLGPKAFLDDLDQAVQHLVGAGYSAKEAGIYLMAGLPGQTPAELAADIRAVRRLGARPYLTEYSPIPGSALWDEAVRAARYDIASEPLFHNNTLLACAGPEWTPREMSRLKHLARSEEQRE